MPVYQIKTNASSTISMAKKVLTKEVEVVGLNSNTFNLASVAVDSLEVLASEMLKTYSRKLLEEKILLQHSSTMMMISLEAME